MSKIALERECMSYKVLYSFNYKILDIFNKSGS